MSNFPTKMLISAVLSAALVGSIVHMVPKTDKESDTNPNQEFALVNLDSKTGLRPYVIVDANRDSVADFIAPYEHGSIGRQPVEYIRPGFILENRDYRTNSNTKVMTPVLQKLANDVLLSQVSLTEAVKRGL